MNDTTDKDPVGFRSGKERKRLLDLRSTVIENAVEVADRAGTLIQDKFYTEHEFKHNLPNISKPKIWLWPAIVAAVIFEAYINYGSFLELFRVPGWAIAFAALTGVMVCMAAEQHGKLLKQETRVSVLSGRYARRHGTEFEHPGVKPAYFWVITAFAVTALIGIIYARYGVLYEQHVDSGYTTEYWGAVGVAALLNILAWVIGAAASYTAHSDGIYAPVMAQYEASVKNWKASKKRYENMRNKIINSQGRKADDFEARMRDAEAEKDGYADKCRSASEAIEKLKVHAMKRHKELHSPEQK